jgi:hypothetical protein
MLKPTSLAAILVMMLAPLPALCQDTTATVAGSGALRDSARALYWSKRPDSARVLYERGLVEYPADHALRLDYAAMLVDLWLHVRAREILVPLLDVPEARARAETLLGTMDYWNGDFTGAKARFRRAFEIDSSEVEAKRMFDEIRFASRSWITATVGFAHDDQPLDGVRGEIGGGFYIDPLTIFSGVVSPMRLEAGDSAAVSLVAAEARLSRYAAGPRLESAVAAGVITRSANGLSDTDWTARVSFRLRLASSFVVSVDGDRQPYLYTAASLRTTMMPHSASLAISRSGETGWLGEAGARDQVFEDDNSVRSAWAWLLAPLVRSTDATVRVGYGFSWQDSRESRFRFADSSYLYYTPENVVSHMALASLGMRASPRSSVTVRGAYGLSAREDAPLAPSTFSKRDFHPWNAHGEVTVSPRENVGLSFFGDVMKTAFYVASSAGARVTVKLRAGAR